MQKVRMARLGAGLAAIGALASAGAAVGQPRVNSIITRVPNGGIIAQFPTAGGLSAPQAVTSPFELRTINGPALVATPGNTSTTLVTVQNPSVVFQFPIVPDMDYFDQSGDFRAWRSVGVTGAVTLEACLTTQEAQSWAGATLANTDTTGCPTEDDLVHTRILPRAWYQVAHTNVDEYVIQNGGEVNVPTPVPIGLQQIDTPARFDVKGFMYYYTSVHTGRNDDSAACPSTACGNGNFETRTAPFALVVLPAFMVQLKVLPQTIIYLPPGNASSGSYTVTTTFSTTLSAGDTTEVDNTNANDQWAEDINENGVSADIEKILSLGFTSSDDTKWDTKTTVKAGQSQEHDIQSVSQVQTAVVAKVIASNANVPGANGTVANEAFWGDAVVVLIHPQFAIWDFYGKTTAQLIAASNSTLPDDISEPIANLDSCASATGPFAAGIPIVAATGAQDLLNANDCRALASLDPFYGRGQSANVSARGTLFAPQQGYGISPVSGDGESIDLKQINSLQTQVTNQSVQTYSSTVEDIVATTQTAGLKVGVNAPIPGLSLGLNNSVTLKQGSNIDTGQTMTLTYKNSSATTFRTDIAIEGLINDTVNRKTYQPQVTVYLDNVFGGLMAVDPSAPRVPCKPQPMCQVEAPIGNATLK